MFRCLFMLYFFLLYVNGSLAQEDITAVEIHEVLTDSTLSCRALEIYEDEVYVATSDSRVMKLASEGKSFQEIWTKDTLNNPHFRSLAITNLGVFALSIESPALLYKNGHIVYKEVGEFAFYDAMEFWNAEEGIAMGDPTDGCISIIITRDGGETWTKINCEELPAIKEGEAAFAASDTNIKVLGEHTWIATGGKVSRIYYSPDKGQTWDVYETPVIQGKSTTGLYSVDFADESTGFAIGGDYTDPEGNINNKIRTSDGGKTWKVSSDGQNPGYRSCVQFVPQSNGQQIVAVGFKGIDVSNDGGISWNHLSDEGFYTLRFSAERVAYAAGAGRVAKVVFK